MNRKIPVWAYLFTILVLLLFSVLFAWAAKSRAQGSERLGRIGQAAFEIASFPGTARSVLLQLYRENLSDQADNDIRVPRYAASGRDYRPAKLAEGLELTGLEIWADRDNLRPGWRILTGAFSWGDEFRQGAVLLSPELEAVHFWTAGEADTEIAKARPMNRKLLHGLAVLRDGSVVFSYDGGVSLQRIDWCGNLLWQRPGAYHHAVTLTEGGNSVWSMRDNDLIELDSGTGEILREVTLDATFAANPEIGILGVRRVHENGFNQRGLKPRWLKDPFHTNDVDPLPPSLVADFGGRFEAGDLMVSMRSLNLVYVIDPDTTRIKWWRSGAWVRQHDPDWLPGGEIGVFDNRMNRDFSRIVAIDPATLATRTLVAGEDYDFYSRYRGKFQARADGGVLVASAQQGRAFELDAAGRMVLDIVNRKTSDAASNYVISEVIWLPPDGFARQAPCP